MKRHLAIGIVCMTTVTFAAADELIDTRGLKYEGPMSSYRARNLSLRVTNIGKEKAFPLHKIRSLKIDGFDALNQAETLVGKKKYKEALEEYDKALRSADKVVQKALVGKGWIKDLLADRRYQTCAKSGRINEALKDWLAMMDADPSDKIVQAMMPETFAPRGDPANAEAVKLLDAKLAQLQKDPKAENYTRRLLTLKMKILEEMGEVEKATAAAEAVTQLDAPVAPTEGEKKPEPSADALNAPSTPAPAVSDLDVLRRLVESGKYDDVIEKLAPRIPTLPRNDLAGPLFLLAKAQWLKYKADEPKDKKLLLRAGLNLMWVYSAYGNSDDAPEALFLTADIHRTMNDSAAARRALEELVEQFGGAEDNSWVDKAQDLLDNEQNTK